MKIGALSNIGELPEKYWKEEFNFARKKGLAHLELIVNYPNFEPGASEKKLNKIKGLSKGVGLTYHLLPDRYGFKEGEYEKMPPKQFLKHLKWWRTNIFNPATLRESVKKKTINEIKRTCKTAERLGVKLITIHGGHIENEKDYKAHIKSLRGTLEKLNEYLIDKKVKICVENMPKMIVRREKGEVITFKSTDVPTYAEDLIYVVKGLKNIGITLDLGHANVEKGGAIEFYKKLPKNKVWDMHVHDNDGKGDDHFCPGKGNIDFTEFLKVLKQDNYKGYFTLELDIWANKPIFKEREESIDYIRRILKRI